MEKLRELNSDLEIRKLKHRFVDDQKLNLTVIDDPYWDFYLDLFEKELGSRTLWDKVVKGIHEEYDGNIPKFLEDFYAVRDKMIKDIRALTDESGTNMFDVFNQPDQTVRPGYEHQHYDVNGPFYTVPAEERKEIRKGDVYNEACTGHTFLSLDLEKANVQALSYFYPPFITGKQIDREYSVRDMYEEYLAKYLQEEGLSEVLTFYISRSKYFRQVVFGNLNADRQTKIEKYLIWNAGKKITAWLTSLDVSWEYAQLGSDELVVEILDPTNDIPKFYGELQTEVGKLQEGPLIPDDPHSMGITVRAEIFDLIGYEFLTASDHSVRVYKKKYRDGRVEYKKLERTYRAQIYEILNGLPFDPSERDMVFNYQKEANAKFLNRLRLVSENPMDLDEFKDSKGRQLKQGMKVVAPVHFTVISGTVESLSLKPTPDGYLKRVVNLEGEKEEVEVEKVTIVQQCGS